MCANLLSLLLIFQLLLIAQSVCLSVMLIERGEMDIVLILLCQEAFARRPPSIDLHISVILSPNMYVCAVAYPYKFRVFPTLFME
jgi:hypothetical protein